MNLTDHVNVSMSFCRLKTKSKLIGLLRPQFATIAKFQWFSKAPSPLNGMVWDNHWVQWFFDGFGVTQPLVSMVYDGCPPLVQRWNGYIPWLKSMPPVKDKVLKNYFGAAFLNHIKLEVELELELYAFSPASCLCKQASYQKISFLSPENNYTDIMLG